MYVKHTMHANVIITAYDQSHSIKQDTDVNKKYYREIFSEVSFVKLTCCLSNGATCTAR